MRKLISFLLCLILLGGMSLSAGASRAELPRIVDMADLLTAAEEAALEEQAAAIRTNHNMDAVIVTVDSLDGRSARAYADDYYDDNGYGVGADYSGILLLIAMDTREWYISTCGDAIYTFSDYDLDRLFDAMSDHLSSGDYYDAFRAYLRGVSDHLETGVGYAQDYPSYDHDSGYNHSYRDYDSGSTFEMTDLLIALVIGLAAGGIAVGIMIYSMNTKRAQASAGNYLLRDGYHLRVQRDRFLYSRIQKTPRPKDNGGHGGSRGGGSVHRSSGGRSHGGRGGRF